MTERQRKYREYLQSDHWKALRETVLNRDGFKCSQCGSGERLNVHHKIYRSPWESALLSDLETLCWDCHHDEHWGWWEESYLNKHRQMVRRIMQSDENVVKFEKGLWVELVEAIAFPEERRWFGELIFLYAKFRNHPFKICHKARMHHFALADKMKS